MSDFMIELRKEKRTGIPFILLAAGILGALYAFANFAIRKDTLLSLPLPPMDVLLTQLYGVIMILNQFGIIIAACMIYNIEFRGNAIRKVYVLPLSVSKMYCCKFIILMITLFVGIILQNAALAYLGAEYLPMGTFSLNSLIAFALYSFITTLPVLSFMLLIASRFENIWHTLGIGVVGFLSGLVFGLIDTHWVMIINPFVTMFRPAVAMSAEPDVFTILVAAVQTLIFLIAGLWAAKNIRYE